MSALISPCENYRYWLKRPGYGKSSEPAFFVMLNPSTADASTDDPTIRRCINFSQHWGFSGIVIANLYAYRTKNPSELFESHNPIGKDNDEWLIKFSKEYHNVICAWGNNAEIDRVNNFKLMMATTGANLWCLGITKLGAPRHPLYVHSKTELVPWQS